MDFRCEVRLTCLEIPRFRLGWETRSTGASYMHRFCVWWIRLMSCPSSYVTRSDAMFREFYYLYEDLSGMIIFFSIFTISLSLSIWSSLVYRWDVILVGRFRLESASSRWNGTPFESALALCSRICHFYGLSPGGLSVSLDSRERQPQASLARCC